jgi:hypothetical protein
MTHGIAVSRGRADIKTKSAESGDVLSIELDGFEKFWIGYTRHEQTRTSARVTHVDGALCGSSLLRAR